MIRSFKPSIIFKPFHATILNKTPLSRDRGSKHQCMSTCAHPSHHFHEVGMNESLSQRMDNLTSTLDKVRDTMASLIEQLSSAILWAVPKKKVTHRTKRIRLASQFPKPIKNLTYCPVCGEVKLIHHICMTCLKNACVGKIVETGDEHKGLPHDPLRHGLRRIVKARGMKNTMEAFLTRQAIIRTR